ncbi:MAG: aspartate carbamoyltransferase catalytic subunit [Firmicutes bacterium]|nr:aspartate carbamoyltransferase catalytic subunit [Bacillota bacterium]
MLKHKDLLGLRELSAEEITSILDRALELRPRIDDARLRSDELSRRAMAELFYENSTRTKTSFGLAGKYLGMYVTDLGVDTSSVQKGESLVDTGLTLDEMGIDFMVIRHSMTGSAALLAKTVNAHVINAGDGANEHPTQALLDMLTIRDAYGSFEGLKVTIIGDISHSRVARSNVFGLTKLGAKVTLAGPSTLLGGMSVLGAASTYDIKSALRDADVVMGLRIQFERQKTVTFPSIGEYREFFRVDDELMKLASPNALILHPGPVNRGNELTGEIIDSERSLINRQVKNGLAVRMAILTLLAEGENAK